MSLKVLVPGCNHMNVPAKKITNNLSQNNSQLLTNQTYGIPGNLYRINCGRQYGILIYIVTSLVDRHIDIEADGMTFIRYQGYLLQYKSFWNTSSS